ncbi:MAG: TolC family protein [Gemmatimonadaceae bacterium]|nr:TolC family protein [Gemmatimonadaceae bacterium]
MNPHSVHFTRRVGTPRWLPGVLLAVLLTASGAKAQSRAPSGTPRATPTMDPAALDLASALATARRSGPLAALVSARRDVAVGRVRETAQWPNPTLEWRRENLASPLAPDIFATAYIPLDITGRRLALRQSVGAGTLRATADAEAERRNAEIEVARAWLRAAVADGLRALVQRQYDALREIADVDAQRLREGLVAEAVGLRTSLEADRARVAVVSANAEASRARAELARLMGVRDDSISTLAPLIAPTLPAPPDSLLVRRAALRLRPEVQARDAAVQETQRRLAAERRGLFGDLQLQGGTKQTGGFQTGQIGFGMPMPFFNRNGGARQRAGGEAMEARILRADVERAVSGAVSAAWRTYMDVRAVARDAATFDARGREVSRIARVAYREGHVTLTELLDAERAAFDAMQAHLRWAADAWLARLELERAIGARLDADAPLDLPLLSTATAPGF